MYAKADLGKLVVERVAHARDLQGAKAWDLCVKGEAKVHESNCFHLDEKVDGHVCLEAHCDIDSVCARFQVGWFCQGLARVKQDWLEPLKCVDPDLGASVEKGPFEEANWFEDAGFADELIFVGNGRANKAGEAARQVGANHCLELARQALGGKGEVAHGQKRSNVLEEVARQHETQTCLILWKRASWAGCYSGVQNGQYAAAETHALAKSGTDPGASRQMRSVRSKRMI